MSSIVPSTRTEVPFGVGALDRVVDPPPQGSSVVMVNEPGVEVTAFLLEAAHSHLSAGREVVYVTLDRAPDTVRQRITALGPLPKERFDKLHLVDGFSTLLGAQTYADDVVDDPEDVEMLIATLERVADEHADAFLLFDSLSGLADRAGLAALRANFTRLERVLDRFDATLAAFTAWPYEEPYEDLLKAFDGVIRCAALEDRTMFGEYFTVERADWAPAGYDGTRHLYKAEAGAGVNVYIPKIVVTGASNAGKSTFVKAVSDDAVSVDRMGTTVALDHGHVTVDGITADLFGTPGQVRFDPVLKTVAGQALGVIVLVDATRPSSFGRAKDLLEKTRAQGLPVIVAANKQDLAHAMPPDAVQAELDLDDGIDVMGCSGLEPDTCRGVLERMTDRILERRRPG